MKIDALFLDVDGVLTASKYYNLNGNVIVKNFNDKDFTAIKMFKSLGVYVAWISGDKKVNEEIALKRKIDFFYTRDNKIDIIKSMYHDLSKVAYVGDDLYDIPVLKEVGFSFCPCDSPFYVKKYAKSLCRKGGEGIVVSILQEVADEKDYSLWK